MQRMFKKETAEKAVLVLELEAYTTMSAKLVCDLISTVYIQGQALAGLHYVQDLCCGFVPC